MYEREDIQKYLATRVARPSSAGVILVNQQDEALLLKAHYKPYWSFPGGWVDDQQTPAQAALRELVEETGISLRAEDITFAYVVDRISDIMHTYQFMFRGNRIIDETQVTIVLQADEIAEYRFVSREAILADPINYGGAVLVWARDTGEGYAEQPLEAAA
ncbi:NUDIX hydrolase [Candidatus Saccharibacteria bacterium]|nr:NUDIX hydrolase [Candidatus Saccharibacteria bacterium]